MILKQLKRLINDDRGMESVEWAVLATLIVAGLIGVVAAIGSNIYTKFRLLRIASAGVPN